MLNEEKIKSAFERMVRTLEQRPSFGFGTGRSVTRITNGLTCEVQEGNWKLIADMPENAGGSNTGPTPGIYGRAALGSCLAMGYMMRASKMDIPVRMLEVQVEADFDDGALFGTVADSPPGYSEVRYTVTIDSDAPEEEILLLLDESDKHSPYLDVFSRGQKCHRKVNIISNKH